MCLIYWIPDTTFDKTVMGYVWSLYGSRSLICGIDCYTNLITQQEIEWTTYCQMIIQGAEDMKQYLASVEDLERLSYLYQFHET